MPKPGLGRGLGSLIPQRIKKTKSSQRTMPPVGTKAVEARTLPQQVAPPPSANGTAIQHVRTADVIANPHQPRTHFSEATDRELQTSIKEHGILQPLTVTQRKGGGYELIAGERRLRAARALKIPTVPVIVRRASELEKLELALIENIQRNDLNPIEEAAAYRKLVDEFGLTQDQAAKKMGKSRSQIANRLRMLHLPVEIQTAVADGTLSEGHAKVILSLRTQKDQLAFFEKVKRQNLSVRDTELEIKKVRVAPSHQAGIIDPVMKAHIDVLRKSLGTKVDIQKKSRGAGRIIIEFYSEEELQNFIDQ